MSKFTHSLKESLNEVKLYCRQSEVSEKAKKTLIVFIPGWATKLSKYYKLLKATLGELEKKDAWEFLPFDYDNSTFSLADPEKIAKNLVTAIEIHLRDFQVNYQKIFLFGHSLGGLIARKAALVASEKDWFEKVNLVLLASANRGYVTDSLPVYQIVLDKLTFNLPFLIKKGKRGSDSINEIRLSWLRNFAERSEENKSNKPIAPPTIQLIGDRDPLVKREDSFDIYRFTNTDEKVISGVTHSDFFKNEESLRLVVNEVVEAFYQHIEGNYSAEKNNSTTKNYIKNILSPISSPNCLVFLVHGIRDFAGWHETLEYEIQQKNPRARVVSIRYGYFTALQFLLPLQRRKNVRIFIDHYINEFARNPNIPIHVAAHSYGTYIVGRAIERQPGVSLNRLYFAGSVLPRKFNWNKLNPRFGEVRNDCANADWAVGVLCRYLRFLPWNWGDIGTAGVDGFSRLHSDVCSNQYIEGDHGAALQFPVTQEIAAFLLSDSLTPNEWQLQTPVKNLQRLQLKLYTLAFLLLFILLLGVFLVIIIFSSVQWLAVIFSAVFTFIVIWFLLSV